MQLAFETLLVLSWILTPVGALIGALVGAYFGGYLREMGQRKAIQATMQQIERRAADITEAARLRWSRRSEVCANLYGGLIMAAAEFRRYLSPDATSTDDEVEKLAARCREFDEDFARNALFLPVKVKQRVSWIVSEMAKVFRYTTDRRPEKPALEYQEDEDDKEAEIRKEHCADKHSARGRFDDDGDITRAIDELEDQLRESLVVE